MAFFKKANLRPTETAVHRPRVLIVDDETANLGALRGILESMFEVSVAASAAEALAMADTMVEWAAVVSDYRMPEQSGVELLKKLAQRMPRTRRILLTGYVDIDSVIESINQAQIWKFMVKPYDRDDLRLTVQRAVEAYQMQCMIDAHMQALEREVQARTEELAERNRQLEAALHELEHAARTDPLTGLKNRRYFDDSIDADLALAAGSTGERDLCFFLIDVDHFKRINDTHGHTVGDQVLAEIAGRLRVAIRPGDVALRWGGEEFLIMARCLPRAAAPAYAEMLRHCIAVAPLQTAATTIAVTASIGFAAFPLRAAPTDWSAVLALADFAMYASKRHSRDAWAGFCEVEDWAPGLALHDTRIERQLLTSWQGGVHVARA